MALSTSYSRRHASTVYLYLSEWEPPRLGLHSSTKIYALVFPRGGTMSIRYSQIGNSSKGLQPTSIRIMQQNFPYKTTSLYKQEHDRR